MARAGWIILILAASAGGADWPQWRGPAGDGSSPEKDLPVEWSAERGVLWRAALPGPAAATPVVAGGRVFLSSTDAETGELLAIAIDSAGGRELWRKKVSAGRKIPRNDLASPSPITDGKRVWFTYGNGLIVAFDAGGRELWRRDLEGDYGPMAIKFGYSSSPLLHAGRLCVQVIRRSRPYYADAGGKAPLESYLLAIDPLTGKTLWRYLRPNPGFDESMESYATPTVRRRRAADERTTRPGADSNAPPRERSADDNAPPRERGVREEPAEPEWEIVLAGGDTVTGHDPSDGRQLWRLNYNPRRKLMWRLVPTPVVVADLACVVTPRGGPLFALKAGLSGELGADAAAWVVPRDAPDVCTPAAVRSAGDSDGRARKVASESKAAGDRLIVLDGDRRRLTCVDAAGGETVWQERVETGTLRASPTVADGKVYCIGLTGQVAVHALADGKLLGEVEMGEGPCLSTIVVADGKLFLRTAKALYAVAKPPVR